MAPAQETGRELRAEAALVDQHAQHLGLEDPGHGGRAARSITKPVDLLKEKAPWNRPSASVPCLQVGFGLAGYKAPVLAGTNGRPGPSTVYRAFTPPNCARDCAHDNPKQSN